MAKKKQPIPTGGQMPYAASRAKAMKGVAAAIGKKAPSTKAMNKSKYKPA